MLRIVCDKMKKNIFIYQDTERILGKGRKLISLS